MFTYLTSLVQGRRPDWIAGEVEIPQFHCPRCRDHWYGISDLPCDEELARMRREGLWLQEKDGNKRLNSYGGGKTLRPVSSHREYNTLSSDSSKVKLPKIRHKKEDDSENDKLRGLVGVNDPSKKKRKKRISFQLGNDSQPGSSGPSAVALDGDDLVGKRGRRSENHDSLGKDGVGSGDRLLDEDKLRKGGRDRAGGNDGLGEGDGGSGRYGSGGDGEDGGKSKLGRKSQDGREEGTGLFGGLDKDSNGSLLQKGQPSKGGHVGALKAGVGQNDGENGNLGTKYNSATSGGLSSGNGDSNVGRGGADGYNSGLSRSGKLAHDGIDTNGMKSGHDVSGSGMGMGHGKSMDGKNKGTDGGLDSSSQVSRAGSKGSGSRRGSLGMSSDHGKGVRKGVGYMRAVSPTSSEWGDPHHGRSFISSTATSRTGSTSNLLRDLDTSKDEEPTSRSLPAIVPQIKKKQPLMDFSDLMGGFQLTRAWTFSYHNKM